MSEPSVTFRDEVAVLRLGDGENRFTRPFLEALDAALDRVLERATAGALVTTGNDRFFSNGYDLDWLATQSPEERRRFIRDQQRLLARLLVFPLPTVAAISGHAFGAGALFALTHDVRVICGDHGYVCMPEIDAKIPLRRAMWALLESRLSPAALRDFVLTGARFGGREAVALGLVREAPQRDQLLDRAVAIAAERAGKDRSTLTSLREATVAEAVRGLQGEHLKPAASLATDRRPDLGSAS